MRSGLWRVAYSPSTAIMAYSGAHACMGLLRVLGPRRLLGAGPRFCELAGLATLRVSKKSWACCLELAPTSDTCYAGLGLAIATRARC
jgi:hypothetical protein